MSINFPANVEREIERYAQAQHMSTDEAAVKLVRDALKAKRRKGYAGEIPHAEWQKLVQADPAFEFFAELPDNVIDDIADASSQTRAERFKSRA